MTDKTSIGLYIDRTVIQDIDSVLNRTNCLSRNEFITEAIRRYITFLKREDYSDILTPAYESAIGAKIATTENHIARVLFKQSVELAMMMHVVAGAFEIDEDNLERLRGMCVDEVSRLCGRFKFEDAVRIQKG
ncbi:MAG: hypothetical protein IK108_10050 [Clostridia bacterium]|nr:hypothetical protein [Clostridia bacterium]